MAYKKPQDPLTNNGFGIYPLTTADQVILSDGSRLEKNGIVSANVATAANSEKLSGKSLAEIMLDIYPVGAVYISVNSTSPASLFGGTWEQLQDRFLLAAGSTYSAGSTGGEETHKLTVAETASHIHDGLVWASSIPISGNAGTGAHNLSLNWNTGSSSSQGYSTTSAGGDQPHNNMPPYLAVYMWKRVS